MSTPRASWLPKVAKFPLSFTWGSYLIDDTGFHSVPLVIGAGATHTRNLLRVDLYNNPVGDPMGSSGGVDPCIGYEECFSFNVVSAGAVAATLVREFSLNAVNFFTIANLGLAVAAGPAGAVTNSIQLITLNRFPAYPFLRYRIVNNDGVNAITVNFILTLRAS